MYFSIVRLFLLFFPAFALIANVNPITSSNIQPTLLPEYENRISFNCPLVGLSYERIKPNSFYIGIDGNAFFPTFSGSDILNFEARVGHHFSREARYHFIPTVGGGYLQIEELLSGFFTGDYADSPRFAYASIGFCYQYERITGQLPCGPIHTMGIGINIQGLLAYRFPREWYHHSQQYGKTTGAFPVFGFRGSIPIIFRFGQQLAWDFRIEPCFLYLAKHEIEIDMTWGFIGSPTREIFNKKNRLKKLTLSSQLDVNFKKVSGRMGAVGLEPTKPEGEGS